MLEGKEIEGKMGNVGQYSLDVDDKGIMRVELGAQPMDGVQAGAFAQVDIIIALKQLAARTSNGVDDAMVSTIAKALGRE